MDRTLKDCTRPIRTSVRQNGAAIRSLREKDGQSQDQLAAAAGIQQSALSHIELEIREARLTTLNRIARALGVPVAALLRQDAGAA